MTQATPTSRRQKTTGAVNAAETNQMGRGSELVVTHDNRGGWVRPGERGRSRGLRGAGATNGSEKAKTRRTREGGSAAWGFTDEDLWWLNSFGWTRDDLRSAPGELAYNYPYMSKDDVMAAAFESNGVEIRTPPPDRAPDQGPPDQYPGVTLAAQLLGGIMPYADGAGRYASACLVVGAIAMAPEVGLAAGLIMLGMVANDVYTGVGELSTGQMQQSPLAQAGQAAAEACGSDPIERKHGRVRRPPWPRGARDGRSITRVGGAAL